MYYTMLRFRRQHTDGELIVEHYKMLGDRVENGAHNSMYGVYCYPATESGPAAFEALKRKCLETIDKEIERLIQERKEVKALEYVEPIGKWRGSI